MSSVKQQIKEFICPKCKKKLLHNVREFEDLKDKYAKIFLKQREKINELKEDVKMWKLVAKSGGTHK